MKFFIATIRIRGLMFLQFTKKKQRILIKETLGGQSFLRSEDILKGEGGSCKNWTERKSHSHDPQYAHITCQMHQPFTQADETNMWHKFTK